MTKIRIGRRVKEKGATGFMLTVAGVLVAARMEAGNQRQGEKHTRKLRFTGNGTQAHAAEAEPRTTRDQKGKTMRRKQKVWRKSKYYGGVSKRSQPRKESEDRKRKREKNRRKPETNERQDWEENKGEVERSREQSVRR